MKRSILFAFSILISFIGSAHKPPAPTPLRFIQNKGQWHSNVLFKTDIPGGAAFFEKDGFTWNLADATLFDLLHQHSQAEEYMRFKGHAWKMKFKNSSADVSTSGVQKTSMYYNFFTGNDPQDWASDVSAFTQISYSNLYNHVDMKVYTSGTSLKYDFIVKPGGNPDEIVMDYDGAEKIFIREGSLVVQTSIGEIIEKKPFAYQFKGSRRVSVPCNFEVKGKSVSFNFPSGYDSKYELVIDPELIFSTYSGSWSNNFGYTATFDSEGFLYSGSTAFGFYYPTTIGAYDRYFNGGIVDIAITKYDTTGTSMIYSTYLGGSSDEMPHSMIVNSRNELYLFGTTSSADFPVTPQSWDTLFNGGVPLNFINRGMGTNYPNGSDIIITKFNQNGTELLASTFLGGSGNDGIGTDLSLLYNYADEVRGEIDIDPDDNIYIASCTRSADFPVTPDAIQQDSGGGLDGCIVKMNPELTNILWSTYLGGSAADALYSVAFAKDGQVYVAGGTSSDNIPVTDSIIQPEFGTGRSDGYLASISGDGSALLKATFYGFETYDQIYFIETDFQDNVYVLGQTEAEGLSYIHNAEYNTPGSGQFITKFTSELDSIIWSTAFGTGSGGPDISPTAFLVDHCRKIYLAGWGGEVNQLDRNNAGYTTGLDITPNAFQTTTDGNDFYLMVLEDDASFLSYATFMGGPYSTEHVDGGTSRFDRSGKIYHAACAGCGGFSDFPIYPNPGAVSPYNNHSCNSAVFKIDFDMPAMEADFLLPDLECNLNLDLTFENRSVSHISTHYYWDFGDGNTSEEKNPEHTYTESGTYTIKLIVADSSTCNLSDTTYKEIVVRADSLWTLPDTTVCLDTQVKIGKDTIANPDYTYLWIPEKGLNNPHIPDPILTVTESQEYTLLISYSNCIDTVRQQIYSDSIAVELTGDSVLCYNSPPTILNALTNGNTETYYWSTNPDFDPILNENLSDSFYVADPLDNYTPYFVRVYSENNCPATDSILMRLSNIELTAPDTFLCSPEEIYLRANAIPEDVAYSWNPHLSMLSPADSQSVLVRPLESTTYTVTAVNKDNCSFSTTANVIISDLQSITAQISADTIWQGERVLLSVQPEQGFNYFWYPPAGINNPYASRNLVYPKESTSWTVTITDPAQARCTKDTTLSVYVKEVICDATNFFVPNAFTPNGDGNNDILYVRGEGVYELYFTVYNRWGEKVFETNNPDMGWDGTYKGRDADPGVFVYYLETICPDKKRFFKKGNVTLLR